MHWVADAYSLADILLSTPTLAYLFWKLRRVDTASTRQQNQGLLGTIGRCFIAWCWILTGIYAAAFAIDLVVLLERWTGARVVVVLTDLGGLVIWLQLLYYLRLATI